MVVRREGGYKGSVMSEGGSTAPTGWLCGAAVKTIFDEGTSFWLATVVHRHNVLMV